MTWMGAWAVVLLVGLGLTTADAQAPQKRVALIIANAAYEGQPVLSNPTTDATLVKPALERAGFTVTVATNANRTQQREALVSFASQTRGAQAAVIYFAGHGLQEGGVNWLLPVDFQAADLNLDADNFGLDLLTTAHRDMIQAMAGAQVRILVLDACRNNPFAALLPVRGGGMRAASAGAAGLVEIEDRRAVIVLSAEAGRLANDGDPRQGSPFARAFADGIDDEGVELSLALRRISSTVATSTSSSRNPQRPKINGIENLGAQEIFLRGAQGPMAVAAARGNPWVEGAVPVSIALSGHMGGVTRAAFSPDGARIVTASHDKTADVWDAATGRLLLTLSGHTNAVNSAAFSNDGSKIVTASFDNTARVWDATSGKLLLTLEGHTGTVYSAAFSPDNESIVTASADTTASIWDARSGRIRRTLEEHASQVMSASFSPNGAHIVTAGMDFHARVWDSSSGRLELTLNGAQGFNSAAFSPNGKFIVTTSIDNTARIWDAANGRMLLSLTEGGGFTDAAFSRSGSLLVTSSTDKTARVWDVATGRPLVALSGHTNWVWSGAFSPDGASIVTASDDNTARVWRIRQ